MLKIGDFSKLSRISIRMLRHYDEIGLLIPESVNDFTGYRYYSEDQLSVANRITALKNMGFSLTVIGDILSQYEDSEKLKIYLRIKQTEIKEQVDSLDEKLRLLETTLNRLGKDGINMNYNVILKELPQMYVASVRKNITDYSYEGKLWHILMKETAHMNLKDGEPCYTLAIFHDGEFKENDVDVEVQKSVKGKYENTENVVFKTMPPVQIASAIHKGGYDKISEVSEAVANWVRDNGYEFDGHFFDIYHVSPHETQNPEEWVTEVCYPVKKK
ncbi:MerR family transcriptional regulator [Anaerovorax odorimutans]|uniref:MerR family transcriptional regulator n=1 Tax=Anaerovorax odorimutans TaxID=109327 RepID=UPI000420EA19|nr:MerR family transcriptional regulator [Anaerovorax odorimutans]